MPGLIEKLVIAVVVANRPRMLPFRVVAFQIPSKVMRIADRQLADEILEDRWGDGEGI